MQEEAGLELEVEAASPADEAELLFGLLERLQEHETAGTEAGFVADVPPSPLWRNATAAAGAGTGGTGSGASEACSWSPASEREAPSLMERGPAPVIHSPPRAASAGGGVGRRDGSPRGLQLRGTNLPTSVFRSPLREYSVGVDCAPTGCTGAALGCVGVGRGTFITCPAVGVEERLPSLPQRADYAHQGSRRSGVPLASPEAAPRVVPRGVPQPAAQWGPPAPAPASAPQPQQASVPPGVRVHAGATPPCGAASLRRPREGGSVGWGLAGLPPPVVGLDEPLLGPEDGSEAWHIPL
mmetsp:Transcript_19736/g.60948  ORF Transcript_19736/g.60948 Transcript_19736/m.60948 type:complete len:297 (+) Transcript_19736:289-1179(+)